jgi:hypothetical protein
LRRFADFFLLLFGIYGYDSTVTTFGPKWTINSSFGLKLGFTRNLEFMAF